MFLRELTMPVTRLEGVGEETAKKLARLGIINIGGLLTHFPREGEYQDRTRLLAVRDYEKNGGVVCAPVTVLKHHCFGRQRVLKIYVEDEGAPLALVCFNRDFLKNTLRVGERCYLYAKCVYNYRYSEIQSSSFEYEPLPSGAESGEGSFGKGSRRFGRILPVYPLTAGLSQDDLRRSVERALRLYAASLEDEIPEAVRAERGLCHKAEAIRAIHFPASEQELEAARATLVFETLFQLEITVGLRAMARKRAASSRPAPAPAPAAAPAAKETASTLSPLQSRLVERLPFALTPGQAAATAEINRDMDSPCPMARLLQGDVGSGKTLVSFLAALKAVEQNAGQAAIMAPTELLSRQHAENAARLLEPLGMRVAFLTGNIKAGGRANLLRSLDAGEIDIVVGTHALFSRDVRYHNLRLVVIDEQHRFGVLQRQAIMAKGERSGEAGAAAPHLLMMSATPIPRTLALTVFGDMDVSVIRDMPPGRKPVETHLARSSNAAKVYEFVGRELAKGRQAYFVYPLIEAAGAQTGERAADLKAAEAMSKELATRIFPTHRVALIHSKLDEEEKRRTMEAFRAGEVRVLAATSVVEVGVDVPNATCIVIEHAERFGLSTLHQLRGRVGRGSEQSYCFLVYTDQEVPAQYLGVRPEELREEERTREGQRLMVMLENQDGFIIAEKDLRFRGPGQITGTEQSGFLSLGLADPVRHSSELEAARDLAFAILEADPDLTLPEHSMIRQTPIAA